MSKKHPHAQRKKVSTARITPKGAIKKRVLAARELKATALTLRMLKRGADYVGPPPEPCTPPGMPPPWRPRSVKLRNRAR